MGTRTDPATRAWRLFNVLIIGLPLVLGLAFFGWSMAASPRNFSPPCGPPAYHLSQDTVHAGESIGVAAPDADCEPRYAGQAQVEIRLLDKSHHQLTRLLAPMNDRGGFTATLDLPATLPVGDYTVSAMPHDVDWCDDTGRNNRVAGSLGSASSASCAEPAARLTITAP
ncbi:hypothetical protein [Arthrobacter sp. NPDC090010]|uniref:hypothetical protein n=1 Tax=Arthrobacter sp. NPDC090010 TaxID=3363942 RepID=UPI0038011815